MFHMMLVQALAAAAVATSPPPFIVQPYLQLGDAPTAGETVTMALLWHSDTTSADWEVDLKPAGATAWKPQRTFYPSRIDVPGLEPYDVFHGTLGDLAPGSTFQYRVKRNGAVVFTSSGLSRKTASEPYRVVVFGDCGQNTPGQRAVAYRAYLEHPDFVAIPGDIVYGSGRMSEYRTKFFPIYNADSASPANGAPLTRSIPFVAAIGNHDASYARNVNDSMADYGGFFAFWSMPLNGPTTKPGHNAPLMATDSTVAAVLARSYGHNYPRMANYSFDYGNTHWTVLDADPYMDWTDPVLRNWVAQDLAHAAGATWRFVMFHQPGFNSSREHFTEQQMRLMSDVFEAGNVDLVLMGHVHNYQRSYPMTFLPKLAGDPKTGIDGTLHAPDWYRTNGRLPFTIDGDYRFDHEFDGVKRTVPKGVIYIVTGGGGAELYNPEQTGDRGSWQAFTYAFEATQHSLSAIDVKGRTITFRQVGADGSLIDHFTITKPVPSIAAKPGKTLAVRSGGRSPAGSP
jgi:predicted phosphohydrolase